MKTIALCFNLPMDHGEWRDPGFGKKYPGAGWMRHLFDSGEITVSGKNALDMIAKGRLDPKQVIVVQEERNGAGMDLIGMGADPRVLMCLESPIFAPHFYDDMECNQFLFNHVLLFNGGTEHIYFPSFDDEDLKDPVPWNDRQFLCMVTANKHYSMLPPTDSPSFKRAMETQLHDYRYQAIEHFTRGRGAMCDAYGFDLFGRGWAGSAFECQDKLATIRNYQFALCFENGSYPGYVTEKVIDCLVAGVIPVYRGAPDIEKLIPGYLYVDARGFETFDEMEKSLMAAASDGNWQHEAMKWGQEWLRSSQGQRYNNRVFAKRVLEMCE